MKPEIRFSQLNEVDERTLSGLALPYETETDIGAFREMFSRGAAIPADDAILNLQHSRLSPIARAPQSLEFENRNDGLYMRATLPAGLAAADEALAGVVAGIYRGLSLEFIAQRERISSDGVRVIDRAQVMGLAVVDRAAYQDSHVSARWRDGAPPPMVRVPMWRLS